MGSKQQRRSLRRRNAHSRLRGPRKRGQAGGCRAGDAETP
jgi:hypothetical protein